MERITPGIVAIIIGGVAALLLFVPFVFISYRRRGGMTFWRTIGWLALLIVAFSLISYTSLPAPQIGDYMCTSPVFDPLTDIRAIIDEQANGGSFLSNPALQVTLFNVLFFMPLGFLLRAMFGFGVARAAIFGFAASLTVELTQLTGIWGLYPCSYRLFSVGDLETNTLGAVLGSLVALLFFRNRGARVAPDPSLARPVTVRRRLLAMSSDVLASLLVGLVLALALRLVQIALGGPVIDAAEDRVVGWVAALLVVVVQLTLVLRTGSTLGEHAVLLRGSGGWRPRLLARIVRVLLGISGILILDAIDTPWADALTIAIALASVVALFTTRDHRGLAAWAAGMQLADSREAVSGESAPTVKA